ncbi:hypothetical protein BJY16_005816 [Actinoplanes octamycinicus]|uniref:DUF1963 domain-containing protein n=1 Tax=Actinoplanes octamycinicus TaxID=135948 RepID=A0A7W7H290_9ACTN|nr:hypothetical protein [Actinoplanes octamycinicus]MBB4742357.1 hypothetical protein [Actinoplanes octamycinicus]
MTSADGPFSRWLTPRREMSWRPATEPVTGPVAKLGGQPHWLAEPLWPVSRSSAEPMTFVGQFPLPGPELALAYLFVSDEDGTYDLDGGENALLVQPDGRVPPFVTGVPRRTGPALWRRGADWFQRVPVELHLDLREPAEPAVQEFEREVAYQEAARRGEPVDERGDVDCRSYAGGEPLFWQPWTPPELDASWRFFFQLDGAEGADDDPFALNFGGGTGYAFLSVDRREGRFCWDCV